MKIPCKLTALAVCVALLLSLASCADFGAGENEDDFKKYFSGVYVLSKSGAEKYSIEDFNRDIHMEDMDIPIVVSYNEYCYIGFRVSEEYTLSLSEFAFFAKTQNGEGELELEFYITDKMPTSIKDDDGNDVEMPGLDEGETQTPPESDANSETNSDSETETETEIREEDLFFADNRFYSSQFTIGEEWDSILLKFDGTKTVKSGQFVIVRIKNNCYSESDGKVSDPVAFTFNYLLFYINSAHK